MSGVLNCTSITLPFSVNKDKDSFIQTATRLIHTYSGGYRVSLDNGATWTNYPIVDVNYSTYSPAWVFGDKLYICASASAPAYLFTVDLIANTFVKKQLTNAPIGACYPIHLLEQLTPDTIYGVFYSSYVNSTTNRTIYGTLTVSTGVIVYDSYAVTSTAITAQPKVVDGYFSNVAGVNQGFSCYSTSGQYYVSKYTSKTNKSFTASSISGTFLRFFATKNYYFCGNRISPSYSTDGVSYSLSPSTYLWSTNDSNVISDDLAFGWYMKILEHQWSVLNADFTISDVSLVINGQIDKNTLETSLPLRSNIVAGNQLSIYPDLVDTNKSYLTAFSFSSAPSVVTLPAGFEKTMTPILNHSRWLALK